MIEKLTYLPALIAWNLNLFVMPTLIKERSKIYLTIIELTIQRLKVD